MCGNLYCSGLVHKLKIHEEKLKQNDTRRKTKTKADTNLKNKNIFDNN